MKRVCALLCLLVIVAFSFTSCKKSYHTEFQNYNTSIVCNSTTGKAFLGSIYLDATDEGEIVLPSEYEGCTITQLGGIYKKSIYRFDIDVNIESFYPDADDYYVTSINFTSAIKNKYKDDYSVEYYDVRITLPKNLQKVERLSTSIEGDMQGEYYIAEYIREDGSKGANVICVRYYFSIDEENEYFYTDENGRFFNRKTEEMYLYPYYDYMLE